MEGSEFSDNRVAGSGGGIYFAAVNASIEIRNSAFSNNTVEYPDPAACKECIGKQGEGGGGAVMIDNVALSSDAPQVLLVEGCEFTGNQAEAGSVLYSLMTF